MNPERARADVLAIFERVVSAVDPAELVRSSLAIDGDTLLVGGERHTLRPDGRLALLAVGKAAGPMVNGAFEAIGDRIASATAVIKRGGAAPKPFDRLAVLEASHPIPDESSVEAGRQLLAIAERLGPSDLVIVLVSGGGSALVEAPTEGLELQTIVDTTSTLLRAGADIHTLNAVRRRLSRIKAGGLARACAPARVINLVISDVLGNALPVIASGLSVDPGPDQESVMERLMVSPVWHSLPLDVQRRLRHADAQASAPVTNVVQTVILADAEAAARAAADAARQLGYQSAILGTRFAGEAKEFARFWSTVALHLRTHGQPFAPPVCLVGAGELTVTVRGRGRGGRNTEMASAAALEIAGIEGVAIASLATDGDDGISGAAGGVVTGQSVGLARAKGLEPEALLAENDSAPLLRAADGLVVSGPTGTNVNDIYLALIP